MCYDCNRAAKAICRSLLPIATVLRPGGIRHTYRVSRCTSNVESAPARVQMVRSPPSQTTDRLPSALSALITTPVPSSTRPDDVRAICGSHARTRMPTVATTTAPLCSRSACAGAYDALTNMYKLGLSLQTREHARAAHRPTQASLERAPISGAATSCGAACRIGNVLRCASAR